MKVYNETIQTCSKELQVTLNTDVTLLNVKDGSKGTDELNAGELAFEVRLQKAGVTGMQAVPFALNENEMTISLTELKEGKNVLRVVAKYGNFTKSVFYLAIDVRDGYADTASAEYDFKALSAVGDGSANVSDEKVKVELSAPDEVDWTEYSVQVQNISQETSETYALDARGKCSFNVPLGDLYVVILPIVGDYVQPRDIEHAATMPYRTIRYAYTTDSRTELLAITAHVQSLDGETTSILEDLPIIATDTLGNEYIGYFDENGTCNTIEIPYGRTYNLAFPSVGGYSHDHNGEHHTAGLPSREIDIHYTQIGVGVFGIDAQGNKYSIAQIEEMQDKSIIVAGGYNDADLEASSRGDGSYGNGFCWKIGEETLGTGKAWADANVEFDTTRLPFYSDLGALKYAGKHMTDMIIEIGTETGHSTPAASDCAAKHLTINNVDRDGFLPAYDQIYRIATLNKTAFQALYTALGATAPIIWSGYWWTSCQYNASHAVLLYYGGFNDYGKTSTLNVFVCYDL